MSEESQAPQSGHSQPAHKGITDARTTTSSPLARGLRTFGDAASAYLASDASDDALPAVREAIRRFADVGRGEGAQPEELIIALKQSCSSLPAFAMRDESTRNDLQAQFVTWLINAYFGGRAD